MTVSLVGAGPGDPELITVRGLSRVRTCEVLVYDRLVAGEIVREAPIGALRISRDGLSQDDVNALLVAHGKRGRRVVRLKGGDPFVFGRGGEEALALVRAGVPFELVPGVSSIAAVPESAGIPVTHRGVSQMVDRVRRERRRAARRARSRAGAWHAGCLHGRRSCRAARRALDRGGQGRFDAGSGRLARDNRGRRSRRGAARLDRSLPPRTHRRPRSS